MQSKKVPFEQWLTRILSIHPPPCYLMIEIDSEGKFRLLGASSNIDAMNLVLSEKTRKNPIAY